jgi:prophage tail gpP-like protein
MNADSDLDVVSLTVDGKIIEGWDSVRVTRGIERFPSDFDLGLMDYFLATKIVNSLKRECLVKFVSEMI